MARARREARAEAEASLKVWAKGLGVDADSPEAKAYVDGCEEAALVPHALVYRGKWMECPRECEPWEDMARVWADRVWEIYHALRPDDLVSVYTCERVDEGPEARAQPVHYAPGGMNAWEPPWVACPVGTSPDATTLPGEVTCPACVEHLRHNPIHHLPPGRARAHHRGRQVDVACGETFDRYFRERSYWTTSEDPNHITCPDCLRTMYPNIERPEPRRYTRYTPEEA